MADLILIKGRCELSKVEYFTPLILIVQQEHSILTLYSVFLIFLTSLVIIILLFFNLSLDANIIFRIRCNLAYFWVPCFHYLINRSSIYIYHHFTDFHLNQNYLRTRIKYSNYSIHTSFLLIIRYSFFSVKNTLVLTPVIIFTDFVLIPISPHLPPRPINFSASFLELQSL